MALAPYTEFPKESFTENVSAALVGKEGWPVEAVNLNVTAGKWPIQILASGIYIGVIRERLEGSSAYLVDTRGPIRRGVASAAIALGANGTPVWVKQSATGLAAANSADKACGLLLQAASGAGSIVSFMAFDAIVP